ncbi:MAG TPA: hypothetical protein VEA78_08590, partial [Acidimicrobiales bacterium]|nr:hypothetical protein [Acidimicrobiales bacterium]
MALVGALVIGMPGGPAIAEQASGDVGGRLDLGSQHGCAVLATGQLRCWGSGSHGRLGHGNETAVGDDEAPSSGGPVSLGAGRRATAVSAGSTYTCALLDDHSVRCWGTNQDGELGLGHLDNVGDDELPS